MENPHRLHGPSARELTHAQQRTATLVNRHQDRRRLCSVGGSRLTIHESPSPGGIETDRAPAGERGFRRRNPGPQCGRRDLGDVGRRNGGVSLKRSDPDALEPLDDGPAAEGLPDVGGQRADIRPLPADDAEPGHRRLDGLDHDGVDDDLARLACHLATFARQLVEAPTLVMNRRIHRRHLPDSSDESTRQPLDVLARERRNGRLGEAAALEILRVGGDSEADGDDILLLLVADVGHELRRFADENQQDADGGGVEGAAVTHGSGLQMAADKSDDVVRRDAGGLVDRQDARDRRIHSIAAPTAVSTAWVATVSGPAIVKPAAFRCPPPPNFAAMALTSTSPLPRRLTFTWPSRSRSRHATRTDSTERG